MSKKPGRHLKWRYTQKYSVALTADMYIQLNERAVFCDVPMAEIVRLALREFLMCHQRPSEFDKRRVAK